MKKIVVTGACGFIGSHLCEMLVKKGYKVIAFDRYNINNDKGWLEKSKFKKDIEFILGDIRDYESVHHALKNCNHVFHLAALIGIPYSYSNPLAYIKTNVEGTYNVLSAAKMHDLQQIIITSTSEVYGSAKYIPIDENHPCVGQSPYSASKISADQLAISFYKSFNLPIKIARPFNTYGPRQSERAVISSIIRQILDDNIKSIKIGSLETKRDFNYVQDTVSAFISLAEAKSQNTQFGSAYNAGTGQAVTIDNVLNKIIKLTGINKKIIQDKKRIRPKNSEVYNLVASSKKLNRLNGWKPEFTLEEGLLNTINWWKERKKKNKIRSSAKYAI